MPRAKDAKKSQRKQRWARTWRSLRPWREALPRIHHFFKQSRSRGPGNSAVDPRSRDSDAGRLMTDRSPAPIVAAEGWHVLHLFYKIEYGAWSLLSQEEQFTARTRLSDLVAEIATTEGAQLLTFAMV